MGRDRRYTEKVRNCQAFAADFFSFSAGKKGVEVFSSILKPMYRSRTHLFLYEPSMYDNPTPDETGDEDELSIPSVSTSIAASASPASAAGCRLIQDATSLF